MAFTIINPAQAADEAGNVYDLALPVDPSMVGQLAAPQNVIAVPVANVGTTTSDTTQSIFAVLNAGTQLGTTALQSDTIRALAQQRGIQIPARPAPAPASSTPWWLLPVGALALGAAVVFGGRS